jgi:hypothetical protein
MLAMKQLGLGLNLSTKRTRKREFLDEMERVVPWAAAGADRRAALPEGPRPAARRSASRPCCASTTCSSGSGCRTRRWKRRCTTCRCTASSPSSKADGVTAARRDDDPAVSPPAGEARPGRRHAAGGQRRPAGARADAEDRHGGRCHADRRAELDEERWASATRRCARRRRATTGTSA